MNEAKKNDAPKFKKPRYKGLLRSISLREKINFVRNLAIIVKASVPLMEGLTLIKMQTTSRLLRDVINEMITNVNNGKSLADSFGGYRHLFGDFFVSILSVGEASGTLTASLNHLADDMEKSNELKNKIRSASIYPLVVFCVTIAIVTFLVFFIFPKLMSVFENLNVQLPITTKILIATSTFLLHYGLYLLLGLIAFIIIFKILNSKIWGFRYFSNNLILSIPLISTLIKDISMANFARVFGVLLKSGIKIVDAITITSQTFENAVYKKVILSGAQEVQKGDQLANYLRNFNKLFTPLFVGLMSIGENTGSLDDNLEYLADYYAKEVDYKLKNLTAVIEPLLLLFMGLLIGFVALSIIQPIYQTTTAIK